MAYLIQNNKIELINGPFNLEALQKYVGGYIEIVTLPSGFQIVLNEEGLLKDLPINNTASLLTKISLVGDVVFGLPEEFE